uniref:Uncharacterized protein n=1 Tax=Romanomermis culicivorax TaxID=13658 RepID=A0A915IIJ9_ROMCU
LEFTDIPLLLCWTSKEVTSIFDNAPARILKNRFYHVKRWCIGIGVVRQTCQGTTFVQEEGELSYLKTIVAPPYVVAQGCIQSRMVCNRVSGMTIDQIIGAVSDKLQILFHGICCITLPMLNIITLPMLNIKM